MAPLICRQQPRPGSFVSRRAFHSWKRGAGNATRRTRDAYLEQSWGTRDAQLVAAHNGWIRHRDYLVEVGSGTILSNLLVIPTSAVTLSGTAGPGVYFVRVRARNPAGIGPPSNEVVVTIPGAEPGVTLTFQPRKSSS
jgi:hypothetical protein